MKIFTKFKNAVIKDKLLKEVKPLINTNIIRFNSNKPFDSTMLNNWITNDLKTNINKFNYLLKFKILIVN
jgi:hypothetical protein